MRRQGIHRQSSCQRQVTPQMLNPALAAYPLHRPLRPRLAAAHSVAAGEHRLLPRGILLVAATHAPTLPGRSIF
jgi:hypothetical protein